MIKDNYSEINARILEAAKRAGREEGSVKLIAVSKTKPLSDIYEAAEAGAMDFGENYVQELSAKLDEAGDKYRFHMIGHLQTNKVKYIVGRVCLIHSVDSLKLAMAIDKEASKRNVIQDILIEINIADENSKTGIDSSEAVSLIKAASELEHIRILGLMCMPPATDDPETSRPYFKKAREIMLEAKEYVKDKPAFCELSMGMTGDFEVAIEEGATLVRVGTAIFGKRDYHI